MEILSVIILFSGVFFLGWSNGANDASKCIGTSVGSGLLSYRRAVILVSIFVIIGGLVQGGAVVKTVGGGIVKGDIPLKAVMVLLFTAAFFVALATFFHLPVSTTHAIIGCLCGIGVALYGTHSDQVAWEKVGQIAISWLFLPFISMIIAFVIYQFTVLLLRNTRKAMFWQQVLSVLLIISAAYGAFSLGANNVGVIVGTLMRFYPQNKLFLLLFGVIALSIGALTYGKKVTYTLGRSIVPLDLPGAFAAQLATALGVHLFAMMGIPVSITQSAVGGVIGAGIVRGIKAVNFTKLRDIGIAWVLTPIATGTITGLIYILIK